MGKSSKTRRAQTAEADGTPTKKRRLEGQEAAQGKVRIELENGDEMLFFLGQAELLVEEGCVNIEGAYVHQGSPPLRLAADYHIGGPLTLRAEVGQTQTTVPLAASRAGAVLLFTGLRDVATHFQLQEGGQSPGARNSSFQVMRDCDANAPTPRSMPGAWHQTLNEIDEATRSLELTGVLRVAVTGSRGIGKSTFARLLVNRLLNWVPCVAFLDADPGQPEFTPSGAVSLSLLTAPVLGPPHLHQRPPERSHFLGDVSPQGDPVRYIQAIRSLHSWYCQHSAGTGEPPPPLVVNNHGWIQGMGLQSLEEVLGAVAPSHVVMLESTSARKNLPHAAFWRDPTAQGEPPPWLYPIPGIGTQEAETRAKDIEASKVKVLAPIDARGLSWLAFALRCCGQDAAPTEWDAATFAAVAQLLTSQPPFAVPFSKVKAQVMHTCLGEAHLPAALNCSIVGLTTSQGKEEGAEGANTPLQCLGFGIVRSVDAGKGVLHILTDVQSDLLEQVDVLQVGKLQLPPPLLQTVDKASPYLSFFSIGSDGTGSGVIKSRNTLTREGQK